MKDNILDNDDNKFEVIRLVNDGNSIAEIARMFGVSSKTVSKFMLKKTYKEFWANNQKPVAAGQFYDHHHSIKKAKGSRFILTSAQNNTFVHSAFLAALEQYASYVGAQIIVGTFSYNKNGFQNLEKGEAEWFDNKIKGYIIDEPLKLAEDLIWCGELNILPTAVNALSGFHSYTKSSSGIIPHAKLQMESLPRQKHADPRFAYTTGCVTQRNYIQKNAGQKASFHHIFGALIVEVDKEGDWFVRQLIADTDTGNFHDLDNFVTPEGVFQIDGVEAINWGDIHAEKLDPVVAGVSFNNKDSILDTLRPRYQFVHDVLDFEARNHHNINDPYFRFQAHIKGKEAVINNVHAVARVLRDMARSYCTTVVVESNHDLALQKWLKTSDYRNDPVNALFFLQCQYETYKEFSKGNDNFSVFEFALSIVDPALDVKCLKVDESFMVCGDNGIECGNHGHTGINGSRGSALGYTKLGSRINIGHSHSARIIDGVYQAGVTGNLDMGYNVGGTTWSNSHIVTYANSKRTIITIKNGKWRLPL